MDLRSLQTIFSKTCGLQKEVLLVVGVSGGPDSLCLLHLLHTFGYSVIAVHVNHQLRPEADIEASAVKKFADGLKIPYIQTCVDVKGYAEDQKLSIEESARILRYRFLMEQAQQHNAQAVAVAHQADDQVETVLMHLLRGSGMAGLRGMPYRGTLPVFSGTIPIVRPLLGVWREEILEYCEQNAIVPCYDTSNQDVRYFRNRIRNELVPLLKTYNDQAPQHLWQLANLVGAEEELLQAETQAAYVQVETQLADKYILFDLKAYRALPKALQRRLLREYLALLQENLRDIGSEAVRCAEEFLSRQNLKGTCQILDGVWLSRFNTTQMVIYCHGANFEREFPLMRSQQQIPLTLPGITPINDCWEIKAEWVNPETMDFRRDEWTIYLDGAAYKEPLQISCANTAERFTPIGKDEHHLKLGDLFTNNKVFTPARSGWPILRAGEQILWVTGLKRSNRALVTDQTQQVLKLEVRKK